MQIRPTTPPPSSTCIRISRATQTRDLAPAAASAGAGVAGHRVAGGAADPVDVEHAASGAGPSGSKRFKPGASLTGLLEQSCVARPSSSAALRAVFHPACDDALPAVLQPSAWTKKRKPTGGEFVRAILLRLHQMPAFQRDAVVKTLELQLLRNGWRIDDGQLSHLAETYDALNPRAISASQSQSPSPSGSRRPPDGIRSGPVLPAVTAGTRPVQPSAPPQPLTLPLPLPLPLTPPSPMPPPKPAASLAADLILSLIFSLRPGDLVQPGAALAFLPAVTGEAVLASLVATGVLLQSADGVLRRSTAQAWLVDEGAPFGDALVGAWRVLPDPALPAPPGHWQAALPLQPPSPL